MDKVFIIAEAGVNHNGSLARAKKMVDVAVDAGADAVKFQAFNADALVSRYAPKARYQKATTARGESQLAMLRRLQLGPDGQAELMRYCRRKRIVFLSSPFDLESIDMLARLGLKIFKIPSGEITNVPYLRRIGALKKKVIMSTGMATLKEIGDALAILTGSGTRHGDIILLHCNTEYPTPCVDVNLSAMDTMRAAFGLAVGYSDHTEGIEIPVAAVARGARVIEKHFTLDTALRGPDHKASLDPDALKRMVRAIRNVEMAEGNGVKRPSRSEAANMPAVRKSIVAARDIAEGELFTESNLTIKRPGTGISPLRWDKVLGKKAPRAFRGDEIVSL